MYDDVEGGDLVVDLRLMALFDDPTFLNDDKPRLQIRMQIQSNL